MKSYTNSLYNWPLQRQIFKLIGLLKHNLHKGFPGGSMALAVQETHVQFPGQEDPLKMGMATHSSTLAWRIPWAEEHGGLQFIGLRRVGYD